MAGGWDAVRGDLQRLRAESPCPLMSFPDPSDASREPPYAVELAAWAEDVAAALHATYGELVTLRVGAMSYPDCTWGQPLLSRTIESDLAEAVGLVVTSPVALKVASGHVLRQDLDVTNDSSVTFELHTGGHLDTRVVDDGGRLVGSYVGAVSAVLRKWRVAPGSTIQVPGLIGTASLDPELGYAVPPGEWQLVVLLATTSGRFRSSPLPLSVTA